MTPSTILPRSEGGPVEAAIAGHGVSFDRLLAAYRNGSSDGASRDRVARVGAASRALAAIATDDPAGNNAVGVLDLLKGSGLTGFTVPEAFGGPGIGLSEGAAVVHEIAQADASAGLVLAMHFINSERVYAQVESEGLRRSLAERALSPSGALYGGLVSEQRSGAPHRGIELQTVAARVDGGWRITGRKTYATGSHALDAAFITVAALPERVPTTFLIDLDVPGVRVERSWNALGLRSSASDDLHLTEVFVPAERFIPATLGAGTGAPTVPGSTWSLLLAANYLGIAARALDLISEHPRYARGDLLGDRRPDGDRHRLWAGASLSRYRVAALTLSAALTEAEAGTLDPVDAAAVKNAVHRSASEIVGDTGEVIGTSSLRVGETWQRLFRDIRTGLHNAPPVDVVTELQATRLLGPR